MVTSSALLTSATRQVELAAIAGVEFDLLVVGGGVVGAGIALDAASRGLSVLLVEAQDFASGTSSRSTKLIHGGLRYLRMFDFFLVREALKERGRLLDEIAPHLVRKLAFCYPFRIPVIERAYASAGISAYGALSRTIDSQHRLPRQRQLSRARLYRENPGLRQGAFRGGVEFYDAQVDDARYVLTVLRTARSLGATVLPRLAATGLERRDGRVIGARLRDMETGSTLSVRSRVVIMAAGVWTEEAQSLAGHDPSLTVRPSKGVHLTVRRERLHLRSAIVTGTEKSVLFVLPWGTSWLIGTTDTPWDFEKTRPVATATDVDYLLAHANSILEHPLDRSDVQSVYAGLRPLISTDNAETTKVSREHAVASLEPGLVAISGGKFTTYRVMASDAVDAAVADWPISVPHSRTAHLPLLGAASPDELAGLVETTMTRIGSDRVPAERLVGRYGTLVDEVLASAERDSSLLRLVEGAAGALRAEVRYAVTHEGAMHIEDVLHRRLRLDLETPDRGLHASEEVATMMASVANWSDAKRRYEVDRFRRLIESSSRAERERDDASAAKSMEEILRDDWPYGLIDNLS